MRRLLNAFSLLLLINGGFVFILMQGGFTAEKQKPLMKDFMGINGHFTFKPELYKQVCRLVRNYHNMDWDVKQPGDMPTLPVCVNRVNWKNDVYSKWAKEGFEIDICAQFGNFGGENKEYKKLWEGKEPWAYTYGSEMAKFFGPSGKEKLCTSIEIDNEPGNRFDDAVYQKIFLSMAKGIREGDPKVKIVSCTAQAREADDYSKKLQTTFASAESRSLFDVINVHTYAMKPKTVQKNPWERSYPEDPAIDYLKVVDEVIDWRNKETPDKEIWVTEFGWDACTDEAMKHREGWFEKLGWTDVTDLEQAQYLVRSFLCFAEKDINRAYIYYYDDNDQASFHAASGLTRKFQPKMSFWAVKHLYETLGNYRFSRIVKKTEGQEYIYEFRNGDDRKKIIWTAWRPTAQNKEIDITLAVPGKPEKIEAMSVQKGAASSAPFVYSNSGEVKLKISGSPVYILMREK